MIKKLDGCKDTNVYQDVDDEDIFILVEEWQKRRRLDDHMRSSVFGALLGMKGLLIKQPEIRLMNED